MSETEVWSSAKILLEKYGPKAAMHAAMMADKLAARKDKSAHETWRKITLAVRELEDAGDHAH